MNLTDPAVLVEWRKYEIANRRANREYRAPESLLVCRFGCGCAFRHARSRRSHEFRFHPRLVTASDP